MGRAPEAPVLHTIGHSNHPIAHFVGLLQAAGIDLLVDVRSNPGSRFHPQFNRRALEASLAASGIGYRWLGDALGGKPKDPALLDADGRPDYGRMAAATGFATAIDGLCALGRTHRVAYMCAEEDPAACHRTRLVTPAVRARGCAVRHLRCDGRDLSHEELMAAPGRAAQPDLFERNHAPVVRPPRASAKRPR